MASKQIVKESSIEKIQKLIFDEDGTVVSRETLEKNKLFKSIVKNHMNKFEREHLDEILDMIYKGKTVKQIQSKFNGSTVKPEKKIAEQAEEIEMMASSDESIFMLNGLKNVDLEEGVEVLIGKDDAEDESDNVVETETDNDEKVFVMSETVQNIKENKKSEAETVSDNVETTKEDSVPTNDNTGEVESVKTIGEDEKSEPKKTSVRSKLKNVWIPKNRYELMGYMAGRYGSAGLFGRKKCRQ